MRKAHIIGRVAFLLMREEQTTPIAGPEFFWDRNPKFPYQCISQSIGHTQPVAQNALSNERIKDLFGLEADTELGFEPRRFERRVMNDHGAAIKQCGKL